MPAKHRAPGLVDRMDLKYVLSKIKTNDNKRRLDGPPECGVTTESTLRHSMPVGGRPHHHFGCTCYHPLFVFNQLGDVERCALRPVNVHSADGWRAVLKPVVARHRGIVKRLCFTAMRLSRQSRRPGPDFRGHVNRA